MRYEQLYSNSRYYRIYTLRSEHTGYSSSTVKSNTLSWKHIFYAILEYVYFCFQTYHIGLNYGITKHVVLNSSFGVHWHIVQCLSNTITHIRPWGSRKIFWKCFPQIYAPCFSYPNDLLFFWRIAWYINPIFFRPTHDKIIDWVF